MGIIAIKYTPIVSHIKEEKIRYNYTHYMRYAIRGCFGRCWSSWRLAFAEARWGRVNLDTGTIIVAESLEQTKKGLRFKSTKSEKPRAIDLPAFAVAELRRHKTEQAKELLAQGIRQTDRTLVCRRANPINKDGKLDPDAAMPPRSCSHEFTRLLGVWKLPRVSLHKLRHSHASVLIAAGENLKTIQERLGHSSIAVTIDLYGHLAETAQATAAARLDKALGGAITPK